MVLIRRVVSDIIKIGLDPVNMTTVRSLIRRMLVYSAIKISANILLLYSVLKPETSSDSPSAKSNGVRLVSARFVVNQITSSGINIMRTHIFMFIVKVDMSMDCSTISELNIIKDMETSYEMVWATPRKAPNKAYLEFEHHPDMNVEYTFILDTHRKYRIPNLMNVAGCEWG